MQKDRDWMAGSKTGKLMGLNAKNMTDLELFLNCSGSRVNSRKVQGLFNKKGRLKRYLRMRAVGSGSGGSGLIQSRSNLVRWLRIGRPGPNRRGTRRRCVAGTQVPRRCSAQARQSSTFLVLRGSIQPVLTGVVLTGGSGRPEMQRSGMQQGRRRWRAAANGRSSWRRRCRGPPGSWIP